MLTEAQRRAAADALSAAERGSHQIAPLIEAVPGLDAADAYKVQQINVRRRVASGAVIQGYKIGLTSGAIQHQLGVTEPDYGHLLSDMFVPDGGVIMASGLCQPQAEVELAFVLSRALGDTVVTTADVLAATACVRPALEIIDSRIDQWRISLGDTIADNASSARVVLGEAGLPPSALDLGQISAVLRKNGDPVEKGLSADVLGTPAAAVCWLANKLSALGVRMQAGSVVLSGSFTRAVAASPGDHFVAEFSGLGSVSVRFG